MILEILLTTNMVHLIKNKSYIIKKKLQFCYEIDDNRQIISDEVVPFKPCLQIEF